MFTKNFKIIALIFIFFYQAPLYSKTIDKSAFNSKNLSNYFSALVAYDNNKNRKALKFFQSSKSLIKKHEPFLKNYIFSLVSEGKVFQATNELKFHLDEESLDFFEGYFLLLLDSVQKKNFKKSKLYIKQLSKFQNKGTMELIIYETLKDYLYLFENKKVLSKEKKFGNLSLINTAFQSCYIDGGNTETYFLNLLNNDDLDYSRYLFFYINYLLGKNENNKVKNLTNEINILTSGLLITQTKSWVERREFNRISDIFSCQNDLDILSEFLFLVANLYSSEDELLKSNFYLNVANYLNPRFKYNLTLLVENHFSNENYELVNLFLNKFSKDEDVYYWYSIKKKASIIKKQKGKRAFYNFLNQKFEYITNPSIKVLFDMANISKNLEKYETAISYYDKVLSKKNINTMSRAEILYRKGGSYERMGNYEKADEDLLKSLEINPDDSYVLNYLAYSWLERNYKIDLAIEMLEEAHANNENDPYILDSVGWGYYLINDFAKAEIFLNKAIQLMPNDPIVNDHYADILWKRNKIIQATYYWQSVLSFEETEDQMKKNVTNKLLKGIEDTY